MIFSLFFSRIVLNHSLLKSRRHEVVSAFHASGGRATANLAVCGGVLRYSPPWDRKAGSEVPSESNECTLQSWTRIMKRNPTTTMKTLRSFISTSACVWHEWQSFQTEWQSFQSRSMLGRWCTKSVFLLSSSHCTERGYQSASRPGTRVECMSCSRWGRPTSFVLWSG